MNQTRDWQACLCAPDALSRLVFRVTPRLMQRADRHAWVYGHTPYIYFIIEPTSQRCFVTESTPAVKQSVRHSVA